MNNEKPSPLNDTILATYRLQLNQAFSFQDLCQIIPYLAKLGITHLYLSPFLRARAGSRHGYDIINPNQLNPEIGDQKNFDRYVSLLHQYGLGQILDIVPNHMSIASPDNAWWWDILEHGEASKYNTFFDIDWYPELSFLHHKILLPVLEYPYGETLVHAEFKLKFEPLTGGFNLHYRNRILPIDPRTYPLILTSVLNPVSEVISHCISNTVKALITSFRNLPSRTKLTIKSRKQRIEESSKYKKALANLYEQSPVIKTYFKHGLRRFNGDIGQPSSFNKLHQLLEGQTYRLAYWQVAADEINYRRFFDINDLAGLKIENDEVFQATHTFISKLIKKKQISGFRVDHPDGLANPLKYLQDLKALIREKDPRSKSKTPPQYLILVEKIIAADYEQIPKDWPISGTTGYETSKIINELFIYPNSQKALNKLYRDLTHQRKTFTTIVYESKKQILQSSLASELTMLAAMVFRIAQFKRNTRDFSPRQLREALREIIAHFPVYRTYLTRKYIQEDGLLIINSTLAKAKRQESTNIPQLFDFLRDILTLNTIDHYSPSEQRQLLEFLSRFQQFTAPVMAKGMEDTAFYRYNRFISLNDVGCDPTAFGIPLERFHQMMTDRATNWPQSMSTTMTHDSKRSEDVRARLNVITEIPKQWATHVRLWIRLNSRLKSKMTAEPIPSNNDEYLLYQTLVGTFPIHSMKKPEDQELTRYKNKIKTYMIKASREEKVHTSWLNPDLTYEKNLIDFVDSILSPQKSNIFLNDLHSFVKKIAPFGLLNSLSQTLIKMTIPGIPDTYQGNDIWAFDLVDPDNRHPVDFKLRQQLLNSILHNTHTLSKRQLFIDKLAKNIADSRNKLYLIWVTLNLRQQFPQLFLKGNYCPLSVVGANAPHLYAFQRNYKNQSVIVCTPRWAHRLLDRTETHEVTVEQLYDNHLWEGTHLLLPIQHPSVYHNHLTGEKISTQSLGQQEDQGILIESLFKKYPLGLLTSTTIEDKSAVI